MKKTKLLLAVMGVVAVVSACGQKADTATTAETTAQETTVAKTTEETTTKAEETETESAVQDSEFHMITGTVLSIDEGSSNFIFKADNGEEMAISYTSPDMETTGPIETDYRVTVVGKGKGESFVPVLVVDESKDLKTETLKGTVIDQAMSAFTIKGDDGKEISFVKNNFEGSGTGVLGQASGEGNSSEVKVEVTYVSVSFGEQDFLCLPLKVVSAE